jgi:multiple sugar transport system substrate-binding protein
VIEIESSVMGPSDVGEILSTWAREFEQLTRIHVHLVPVDWNWNTIFKYGVYGHGPDVSEVGSSWVASLAAMNALRPFTVGEVRFLGGAETFLAESWKSCLTADDFNVWGLPWTSQVLVLYYRKDLLEQFGIARTEEECRTAFATHSALVETLSRLQAEGVSHPLALWVTEEWYVIHSAASWVWGAGGEFIVPEGNQVIFDQPAAMAGLRDYFGLRAFMRPSCTAEDNSRNQLYRGSPAVAIECQVPYIFFRDHQPEELPKWGISSVPGVPYIGGSNLVIWKHSRQPDAAMKWVQFLIKKIDEQIGAMRAEDFPTRLKALDHWAASGDRFAIGFVESLKRGRGHVSARLWGLVEEKLLGVFPRIWEEVLSDPSRDVEEALHQHLDPLSRNLNRTLKN